MGSAEDAELSPERRNHFSTVPVSTLHVVNRFPLAVRGNVEELTSTNAPQYLLVCPLLLSGTGILTIVSNGHFAPLSPAAPRTLSPREVRRDRPDHVALPAPDHLERASRGQTNAHEIHAANYMPPCGKILPVGIMPRDVKIARRDAMTLGDVLALPGAPGDLGHSAEVIIYDTRVNGQAFAGSQGHQVGVQDLARAPPAFLSAVAVLGGTRALAGL